MGWMGFASLSNSKIMTDPEKIIESIGKNIDRNFESEEERQQSLSDRHSVDMLSDNWLSKAVRPIITLTLLGLFIAVVITSFFGVKIPEHIGYELGAMLTAAIGFYFQSRRNEKMNSKKMDASVKIEKMRLKNERIKLRKSKSNS